MNRNIPEALCQYLDHALAFAAADASKAQMREELLAHLLALFDEEFARLHDGDAAAAAAIRRFGDADTLCDEIKSSVPSLFARKEPFMRWLFVILGIVAILVGAGFVMPALGKILDEGYVISLAVTLLLFGSALAVVGVWSIVHGARKFRAQAS